MAQIHSRIPHINLRDTPLPPSPVLKAAGVKSRATLHRGARYCSVLLSEGVITIAPSENKGARGGFLHLDPIEIPEDASDAEFGAALERAFAACR